MLCGLKEKDGWYMMISAYLIGDAEMAVGGFPFEANLDSPNKETIDVCGKMILPLCNSDCQFAILVPSKNKRKNQLMLES